MISFDRTFRLGEHMVSTVRGMLPRQGRVYLVCVEPKTTPREGGGTSTSIGFPALIVPDYVEDQKAFAEGVVKALNAAALVDDLVGELKRLADHLESWVETAPMDATTETWGALHCARALIAKAGALS